MADDAKLLAVIDANTKAFENALKRLEGKTDKTFGKANQSVRRLNASLKLLDSATGSFGAKLGLAFSAAGAIALAAKTIRSFIQNTIESEDAIAQLNAALKSTGGAVGLTSQQLQNLAAGLQKVTVFGDEAILGAENLLLTFTKIGGDVFPDATEAVLDLATRMRGDLKGAAVQVGKALQDPIKGITALRKVGVTFSDAQRTIIKDLVKSGDLAAAQVIILKELQVEFGGSARAARDTLGGALTALSEAWGDLFEVSGPASDQLRLAIEDMITAISDPKFKEAVSVIGVELLGALKAIIDFAPKFSQVLRDLPQDIASFTADIHGFAQSIVDAGAAAGRFTGARGFGEALGLSDLDKIRIDQAHQAVLQRKEDEELLAALQKKFTIAPGEPAQVGGAGLVGIDPDALDEAAAAEEELADALEAEADAQKEAAKARKQADAELARQKEAVLELISDLEFEKSIIGLSNEQREIEIALRRAGAAATTTQRDQITSLVAAAVKEQEAFDLLIDRMDELRNTAGSALDAFAQSIASGEGATAGLKAALVDLLQTIIRIGEQQAIKSLFGAFGTAGGGGIGGIIGGFFGGAGAQAGAAAGPLRLPTPTVANLAGSRSLLQRPTVVELSVVEGALFRPVVTGISQGVSVRQSGLAEQRAVARGPAVARDAQRRFGTP